MRTATALLCVLWLPFVAPASGASDKIEPIRAKYHLPAMAWVVVNADTVIDSGAIGVRKLKSPTAVTVNDHFHLGSNTKAMTATVIATVVEQGKLSWTSNPVDVFPDLKGKIDPGYQKITLTSLLTHWAGIPPFTDTDSPEFRAFLKAKVATGSPVEQRRALLHWILTRPPAVPPGSKMLYSNAGVALAAAMMEQATGESWESLMESRLFQPLGIHGGFDWPAMTDPNQPWGHLPNGKGFKPHDPHDSFHLMAYLFPAGGVYVSIGDYGRFLQMHLQGLAGKDTLVKAATMRYLHTPIGESALGWGVTRQNDEEVHGHSGSAGTFFITTRMFPGRGLAIAVATNAGGDEAAKACREAIDALR